MLYSLDEICLIPAVLSKIEHRGDVNVFTNKNNYPIFTAPMASIVDQTNIHTLKEHRLNVIIPRSVAWKTRMELLKKGEWVAVGLKEAQYIYEFIELQHFTVNEDHRIRLCIDQANGHMESLLKLCKNLKERFGENVKIMTGNIANPYAYKHYAMVGVDYVRVGIGGGNVCTTSVQTNIHYPMGSLLIKLKEEREFIKKAIEVGANYKSLPKIIADGGFKNIKQCVTALALGADFIMLGEILAKSEEACGKTIERSCCNMYFGMSTEKAQILVNEASLFRVEDFTPKHSEGQVKWVSVDYTLKEWEQDFEHALRSSMSYAGAKNLDEFIGRVNWETLTPMAYHSFMK